MSEQASAFEYKDGNSDVYNEDTTTTLSVDSTFSDSISVDSSSKWYAISPDTLDAQVKYQARDSIIFMNAEHKVLMYGDAQVKYQTIELKADFIELDWKKNLISASAFDDTLADSTGTPVFIEDGTEYKAERISYNYQSGRGKISHLITKEGEGYIHGQDVLKTPNDNLFIRSAGYTTCDLEHPHFSIRSGKLKVIPEKVVISGPAYLTIEDVPTPLVLPFGIFPITQGRTSGILFPEYGESRDQGYFLRNGGYYFAISDKMDLSLRGTIYSRGSWGLNLAPNYRNRYRYNGSLDINYAVTKRFPRFTEQHQVLRNFFIKWRHNQDPKARPNSSFNAFVEAGSNSYYTLNTYNSTDYLANTFKSSIAYTKSWAGKPYRFNASLGHDQNTRTRIVNLNLPTMAFNVSRVYPFKKKVSGSKKRWYDRLGVSYTMDVQNTLSLADSLLFEPAAIDKLRYGIRHSIPVTTSFKLFKYFTLTPGIDLTDRMYLKTIRKEYDEDLGTVRTDTVSGFSNAFDFTTRMNLTTKLFGTYLFKKGKIKGLQHVITPSLSFQYRPDFSDEFWGAYREYETDSFGSLGMHSIFEQGIYSGPPTGKYGGIGLNIDNFLEMKVFSKKDTVNNAKKIRMIDAFSLNTFYNLAKDSLNLSPITMNGRASITNKIKLQWIASFDPYVTDSLNRNLHKYEWNENGRIGRLKSQTLMISTAGLRLPITQKKSRSTNKGTEEERDMINRNRDAYVDFSIPWNLTVNYSLTIRDTRDNLRFVNGLPEKYDTVTYVQSLNLSFEMNVTQKWRVNVSSGYDFVSNKMTYTSVNIYRDLHCWEMKFNWIPFGFRQSYSIDINVRSSVLQDLKLSRKRDWYDYQ
jgi:hypothetical protein